MPWVTRRIDESALFSAAIAMDDFARDAVTMPVRFENGSILLLRGVSVHCAMLRHRRSNGTKLRPSKRMSIDMLIYRLDVISVSSKLHLCTSLDDD